MFFITVTAHVSCRQCLQLSTELQTHKNNGNAVNINISASLRRARDGTRTRDPDLGKVVLHQLSHSRILLVRLYLISYVSLGQVLLYYISITLSTKFLKFLKFNNLLKFF